jgi:ferredoxin--NADP+ reductase
VRSGAVRCHASDRAADTHWLDSREPRLVTEQGWQLIDAAERAAGEKHGRPRIKLCNLPALLSAATVNASVMVPATPTPDSPGIFATAT